MKNRIKNGPDFIFSEKAATHKTQYKRKSVFLPTEFRRFPYTPKKLEAKKIAQAHKEVCKDCG